MSLRREANINVPVVTAGTHVSFDSPWTGLSYVVFKNCWNSFGDVGCNITNKTASGFDVLPVEDGYIDWEAVQTGAEVVSGRLSRDWTAGNLWIEAVRNTAGTLDKIFNFERFNMIDHAVQTVAGQFYSVFGNRYVRENTRTVTSSRITISNLRIMHSGQELRLKLWSTLDDGNKVRFVPCTYEELVSFRSCPQYRKKIMYSHEGDFIELAKGTSVDADYGGNVSILYPSVPIKALNDSTYIDLPDGIPTQLVLVTLEMGIVRRFDMQKRDRSQEVAGLLSALYNQFGVTMNLTKDDQEKKVRAVIGG